MKLLAVLAVSTVTLGSVSLANADQLNQNPEGSFIFRAGMAGVMALPESSKIKNSSNGTKVKTKSELTGALSLTYLFAPNMGIQLSGTLPSDLDQDWKNSKGGLRLDKLNYQQTALTLQYYIDTGSSWQPYLGLGASYNRFEPKLTKLEKVIGLTKATSDSTVSPIGEVGVDYYINQNWLVNASVSYTPTTYHQKTTAVDSGKTVSAKMKYDFSPMVARLNIGWRF